METSIGTVVIEILSSSQKKLTTLYNRIIVLSKIEEKVMKFVNLKWTKHISNI